VIAIFLFFGLLFVFCACIELHHKNTIDRKNIKDLQEKVAKLELKLGEVKLNEGHILAISDRLTQAEDLISRLCKINT